jgi:hypothetical protein
MQTVTVQTSKGAQALNIPSALKGAKLVKALDTVHLIPLMLAKGTGGASVSNLVTIAQNLGEEALTLSGAIVGISIIGVTDCPRECNDVKFRDAPLDYGEEVYEVLYEQGYSLEDILLMAFAVGSTWLDRNKVSAEAQERLGFTSLMKAAETSSTSKSE